MAPIPDGMFEAATTDSAFIFNFFLRPLVPDVMSTVKGWAAAGERIAGVHKDDGKYKSTHLHAAVSDDSHFQIFNYAVFEDFTCFPFRIATDPEAFFKLIGSMRGAAPASAQNKAIPGGFKEIKGITRFPDKPSLPKRRTDDNMFIVAKFPFEVDIPRGPPPPGSPPGPPGLRPVINDAILKARGEFEADWINVSGASLLAKHKSVNDIYLYRRETHGVGTFVLRAELDMKQANVDQAQEIKTELRKFLDESDFLKAREMKTDVDLYKIIVNGDGKTYEPNEYGV